MMAIDIKDNEQKIIEDILDGYKKKYSFYYYGSRTKGLSEKTSDLDILIKGKQEMPLYELQELKEKFDNSRLPYIVNFSDYHKINLDFFMRICSDLIPYNWRDVKLGDVCVFSSEKIEVSKLSLKNYISTENMLPNKAGICCSANLPNTSQTVAFHVGNILVSNIRPYFKKIWYADFNGGCSNDVLVFQANENIDNNFLYYVLSSDSFVDYDVAMAKGTKMPRGDKAAIMQYQFLLPPLAIQKRIAAVLGALDDKIELNNKINSNLEQQAYALVQEHIIRLETIVPLDEFCNIFTGRKNANEFDVGGANKFFTCGPEALTINSFIYDGPAVIISGNGAYTGRTRFYNGKFDLYQRTYACTLKEKINLNYIYLLYPLLKMVLEKKLMGGTHGSAIPYIVMNDIAKFEVPFDKDVFDNISPAIKVVVDKIQANEQENEKLAAIRDVLLPKLMSGEIDVSNVDISALTSTDKLSFTED